MSETKKGPKAGQGRESPAVALDAFVNFISIFLKYGLLYTISFLLSICFFFIFSKTKKTGKPGYLGLAF
jgi:hypothetical protein